MKKIIIYAFIFLPSLTLAEGRLFGEGWVKCNEFLEDVETNFASVQFQMSWVNGYLSGRSLSEAQPMDSEKHNFLGILEYMKNYCEQNPSQHFAFGVEQLYVDMKLWGHELDRYLIDAFNPKSFNELVDIIYDVLCQVELTRFPKGFAMGQENSGGKTNWNISRERVYVVFPFLQFLKEHSTKFPFQRQAKDGEETILDAMLLAISRFNCFKNYSHDELLGLYHHRVSRGFPIINIWGEDMLQYGILVKKPQTE